MAAALLALISVLVLRGVSADCTADHSCVQCTMQDSGDGAACSYCTSSGKCVASPSASSCDPPGGWLEAGSPSCPQARTLQEVGLGQLTPEQREELNEDFKEIERNRQQKMYEKYAIRIGFLFLVWCACGLLKCIFCPAKDWESPVEKNEKCVVLRRAKIRETASRRSDELGSVECVSHCLRLSLECPTISLHQPPITLPYAYRHVT